MASSVILITIVRRAWISRNCVRVWCAAPAAPQGNDLLDTLLAHQTDDPASEESMGGGR